MQRKNTKFLNKKGFIKMVIYTLIIIILAIFIGISILEYGESNNQMFFKIVGVLAYVVGSVYGLILLFNIYNFIRCNRKEESKR